MFAVLVLVVGKSILSLINRMKTLNRNLKYVISDNEAILYGKRKGQSDYSRFGACHISAIPFLKEDFQKYMYLINVK